LIKQYAAKKKLEMIGAIKFKLPRRQQPKAMANANKYALRGSRFFPKPLEKYDMKGKSLSLQSA